jgi:glycosyltransferase involved in cell wall biosynthesis
VLRERDRVAVCAIMKNEAPYVAEWVAHHRLLGFDRILVYDNDSTDGTTSILSDLRERGVIETIPWPSGARENPQTAAYQDGLETLRDDVDWLLFADADEFLVLKQHETVWEFTEGFTQHVGRIVVNWRCFGSSGRTVPGHGLVIERFLFASPPAFEANLHVKTFVRPHMATTVGVHACRTSGESVNPAGNAIVLKDETFSPKVDISVAQMNHYFTKSVAEYGQKARRGQSTQNPSSPRKFDKYSSAAFNFHDRNEFVDDSATKYLTGIRDLVDSWSS